MMTFVQVAETLVTTANNSPSQDYTHPNNQTTLSCSKNLGRSTVVCEMSIILINSNKFECCSGYKDDHQNQVSLLNYLKSSVDFCSLHKAYSSCAMMLLGKF